MTALTVEISDGHPGAHGFPPKTSSFTFAGPAITSFTATNTDNRAGSSTLTLEDHTSGGFATADVTVGGDTSTGTWVSSDILARPRCRDGRRIRRRPKRGRHRLRGRQQYLVGAVADPGQNHGVIDRTNSADAESEDPVFTQAKYSRIVFYAQGTIIGTPAGERPVEDLKPGELVTSLDHGPVPIRWTRKDTRALDENSTDDKPVLIKAGALGAILPDCNLIVSP